MSAYDTFIHRKPACFGSFDLAAPSGIKSRWATGPEFLTKSVQCSCGETRLNIYASRGHSMHLAPIELECPRCHARAVVFHPEKHGWDGQNGDNCSLVGETPPELLSQSPCRIVVEYSYQGEDNYADLLEDGVENPEDYFDVFAIYTADQNGRLTEVVSYECA